MISASPKALTRKLKWITTPVSFTIFCLLTAVYSLEWNLVNSSVSTTERACDTDYPVLRNISAISPLTGGILYLHMLRLRGLFHLMYIIIYVV